MPATQYLSESYFYIIRDKRNNKYYAGSKFAKDANPKTFWKDGGYFTSSTKILSIVEEFGAEVFDVVRLKVREDAYEYETRFLEKVNAKDNNNFYNYHNNTLLCFGTEDFKKMMLDKYGVDHIMKDKKSSREAGAKQKITKNSKEWKSTVGKVAAEKVKRTKNSKEWKSTVGKVAAEKNSVSRKSSRLCYETSIQNLKKAAEKNKGVPRPEYLKKQWSDAQKGVPKSEEHKQRLSSSRKQKAEREIVYEIRKVSKGMKLGRNWWTKSDAELQELLGIIVK